MARIRDKLHSPLLLFSLASSYVFLLGIQTIAKNVGLKVSVVVVVFYFVVLLTQLLGLKVMLLKLRIAWPRSAILGFLLAANLIAFYLSFSEKFMWMPNWRIALATILAALVFTVMFRLSGLGSKISIFLCLLIVGSLLIMGVSTMFGNRLDPEVSALADFRSIRFDQKPNVHLISFDSMLPEALARKHMGLEQLRYSDYLEDQGAILFKNMFASQVSTSPSLNSIMRLANPDFSSNGYFAGRDESPVSYIFSNNGYKIATGFDTFRVFGKPGSFVDEYRTTDPGSSVRSAICRFNGVRSNLVRLFGYCYYIPIILSEAKLDKASWHRTVLNTIWDKGKTDEPWLTFHYIFDPIGHTTGSFSSKSQADLDQYTRSFLSNSDIIVDTILPELVEIISVDDPASIVFVFGDHGPFLSRSFRRKEAPEFFVQDRHGVFGALLATEHGCSVEDIEYYNQQYSTPERTLAGIIRCLSADPDSIDQLVNFDERFEFGEYLYE